MKTKKKFIIKDAFALIRFNWLTAVLFSIVYTVCAGLVMLALYRSVEKLMLLVANVSYLGNDTFSKVLLNPVNWAIILACLIVMGFIIMVNIGGFLYIFDCSKYREKVSLWKALQMSIRSGLRIFIFKNWGVVIWTVIVIPLMGIMGFSSVALSVSIPGFIQDWIYANPIVGPIYVVGMAVLFCVSIGRLLAFPAYVLEGTDFPVASKKCDRLINKNFFRVLFTLLLGYILLLVTFLIIYFVVSLFIIGNGDSYGAEMVSHLQNNWYMIVTIVFSVVSPILVYALLSSLYYRISDEKGESIKEAKKQVFKKKTSSYVGATVAIVVALSVIFLINQGTFNLGVSSSNLFRPQVVAHRGESVSCPENTMPAFEKAIEEGVDGIELDVHETKDGVIVVTHDDSLKRIAGIDKCVHEMKYDDLKKLDTGSWFSEEFSYVRVSTLKEVLDLCKDKIELQIELKPTDYDKNLEKKVVKLINDADMADQCYVTSLDYDAIKKVKEIDPDIKTLYVLTVVSGKIEKLNDVDGFSIEESGISRELVSRIHNTGKVVYVWTVNEEDGVQNLINAGVDGILSDDPVMLSEALDNADYIGGFGLFLKFLSPVK